MQGLDLIGRMTYDLLSPEHQAIVRKIAEKTIFTTYTVASIFSYCNYNEENTVEQLYMLWIGGPLLDSEVWR